MGKALPEVKTAWGVSQVIFPDSYQEKAEGANGGFVCPALNRVPSHPPVTKVLTHTWLFLLDLVPSPAE